MERCGDYGGKRRQSGVPCGKPAGWGVKDTTTGKCRIHGGANEGRPIIHGRYSVKHRKKLQSSIQKFLDDPKPGDLTAELALNHALLQDFLDRFPDGTTMSVKEMNIIYDMVDDIGKTVERISRILNQTALTQADINYLQAVLTDLLTMYIDDPEKRASFLGELRQAMGPDASTNRKFIESPSSVSIE